MERAVLLWRDVVVDYRRGDDGPDGAGAVVSNVSAIRKPDAKNLPCRWSWNASLNTIAEKFK